MSRLAWLAIAFGAVWLALGAYLVSLATRQRDLERRLESLAGARSAGRNSTH